MSKVAVFVFGYPPAFTGGGPVTSVSRLCEAESTHDLRVVTRDRESLQSMGNLHMPKRKWVTDQKSNKVSYIKIGFRDVFWAIQQMREWKPELYYFNSVHGKYFSIFPILLIKLHVLPVAPMLIAPRGETSQGSLSVKPFKKRLGGNVIRGIIPKSANWHAATDSELVDIKAWLGRKRVEGKFYVQIDHPPKPQTAAIHIKREPPIEFGFASRIHPTKGLDSAIRILAKSEVQCKLVVRGTIEDKSYFEQCEDIARSAKNLIWDYQGPYRPEEAAQIFADVDLAFLLSKGESFGQAIAEALSVGCPVAISLATPWSSLVNRGSGIASDDDEALKQFIVQYANLTELERQKIRLKTLERYSKWVSAQGPQGNLFSTVLDTEHK